MIIMAIMYLITSFASGFAQEQASTVASPAKNANDMIAFIDETVLADYDKFVGMANTYRNTMAQMAEGIDGINIAVDESAQGEVSRFKTI